MTACIALGQLQRAEAQSILNQEQSCIVPTPGIGAIHMYLLRYSVGVCSVLLHLFSEEGGCRGSFLEHSFERGGLQPFPLKASGEKSMVTSYPISDTV